MCLHPRLNHLCMCEQTIRRGRLEKASRLEDHRYSDLLSLRGSFNDLHSKFNKPADTRGSPLYSGSDSPGQHHCIDFDNKGALHLFKGGCGDR